MHTNDARKMDFYVVTITHRQRNTHVIRDQMNQPFMVVTNVTYYLVRVKDKDKEKIKKR